MVHQIGRQSMATTKKKAVVNADQEQLGKIHDLVRSGIYGSVSEFFRDAVTEKLDRIRQEQIADAVERYCAAGHADEDLDLIGSQALPGRRAPRSAKKRSRRASR